jgi:hypothetical protein
MLEIMVENARRMHEQKQQLIERHRRASTPHRSSHLGIAIGFDRDACGYVPSTSVTPFRIRPPLLNHNRFKGFNMFPDRQLGNGGQYGLSRDPPEPQR